MFARFTISLPADFIHQPEKVYRSLMLKQCLEDTVDPKPEAEPEEDTVAEDSMDSTEDSFENILRSQLVSTASDTTNTDNDTDIEVAQALESYAETAGGSDANLHVSNISRDSVRRTL